MKDNQDACKKVICRFRHIWLLPWLKKSPWPADITTQVVNFIRMINPESKAVS
jgi:hypothetical protein